VSDTRAVGQLNYASSNCHVLANNLVTNNVNKHTPDNGFTAHTSHTIKKIQTDTRRYCIHYTCPMGPENKYMFDARLLQQTSVRYHDLWPPTPAIKGLMPNCTIATSSGHQENEYVGFAARAQPNVKCPYASINHNRISGYVRKMSAWMLCGMRRRSTRFQRLTCSHRLMSTYEKLAATVAACF